MIMGRRALLGAGMMAIVAVGAVATPAGAADDPFALKDPSALVVGAGAWEAVRSNLTNFEVDATFRPNNMHLWVVKPQVGIVASGAGDTLLFAGPMVDYKLTNHLVVTGMTSVAFWTGSGFDLGSKIEFRSGAELGYRWNNGVRLGIGFYHTSNADLTKRNPGSESALVEYSIPLRIGF